MGPRALCLASLVGLSGCRTAGSDLAFERFNVETTPGSERYPDVSAVVLLERGTLLFTIDVATRVPLARFRHYRRVKILTEAGLDQARFDIPYDPGTLVKDVLAQVVLPDGEIRPLDPDHLFDVEHAASGRRAKAFRLSEAVVGSVVEATWDVYYRDFRFLPAFRFQDVVPVARAELAVIVPPAFEVAYRYARQGQVIERPPERFDTEEGVRLFWAETDLPALFPEPWMPSLELVSPTVHVVFAGGKAAGRDVPGFASWDDARSWLLGRAKGWATLSDTQIADARALAGDAPTDEQALKMLELVARDLAWESRADVPVWRARTPTAAAVLVEQKGNKSSRGLVLTALLRAIGVDASPALVAERDRFLLFPDLPNLADATGIVAVVPRPQGPLVLDPSQLTVSTEVPPPRLMGARIVILRDDAAEVATVPVADPGKSRTELNYLLRLDRDGKLTGTFEGRFTGAEAGALRQALLGQDVGRYPELIGGFLGTRGAPLAISSVNVADLAELRRPLTMKGKVELPALFDSASDDAASFRIGRLVGATIERPRTTRRAALTFEHPHEVEIEVVLLVPEDHRFTSTPPPFEASWAGGSHSLTTRADSERRVTIRKAVRLGALGWPVDGYPAFADFLRRALDAETAPIELGRPPPPAIEY